MKELIRQALKDENAMKELLHQIEPFVYKVSFYLTHHKEDAEDIAQEVLIKVCTKLETYREDSSFQTWIYTVISNTFRDFYRKKKKTEPLFDNIQTSSSFEDATDAKILLENILSKLPEMDRQVFTFRFQNHLSVKEVAEIMNITESNVKVRIFRLKEKIRDMFGKGGQLV